jgi:hypothetical protein
MIADVGNDAGWRYVEFFTANIRNPHTRRAYARACARFFAWCEHRSLTLAAIRPFDVATYIEGLQHEHSAPGVKQAARCSADAVRLADHRPSAAHQPSGGRARAQACGEDGRHTGARGRRMAQAAQFNSGHDAARSTRPRADRYPHLQLRSHQRGVEDES